MGFAYTIVNETTRKIPGDLAAHLATRISVMDRERGLAGKRRLRLVALAARLKAKAELIAEVPSSLSSVWRYETSNISFNE